MMWLGGIRVGSLTSLVCVEFPNPPPPYPPTEVFIISLCMSLKKSRKCYGGAIFARLSVLWLKRNCIFFKELLAFSILHSFGTDYWLWPHFGLCLVVYLEVSLYLLFKVYLIPVSIFVIWWFVSFFYVILLFFLSNNISSFIEKMLLLTENWGDTQPSLHSQSTIKTIKACHRKGTRACSSGMNDKAGYQPTSLISRTRTGISLYSIKNLRT